MSNAVTELGIRQAPSKVSLPASLERKCRTTYLGSDDIVGTWTAPKSVTTADRAAAVAYLRAAREQRPAASENWLKGRIGTLLAHYFVATAHDGINAMVAQDWMDSLSVFPRDAIEQACAWWRDNDGRKPKPSDIRKLAIRFFGETEWEKITRLKLISQLPVDDTPKARTAEEVWEKPTEAQKVKVRELLEKSGIIKRMENEQEDHA